MVIATSSLYEQHSLVFLCIYVFFASPVINQSAMIPLIQFFQFKFLKIESSPKADSNS